MGSSLSLPSNSGTRGWVSKLSVRGDSHDKTVSTSKTRKQHSPEFRSEALKLAERIGVTAAARELSLYES